MLVSRTSEAIGQPRVAEASGASALETEVAELFDQYRVPLLRYLYSFGLPMQDGEEVVQEVFLSLFRHLREGKPRTNLRGWIFRVGHNLGLRRRQREMASARETDGGCGETHDPGPNPEELVAGNQRRARLLAVVDALPDQDRSCLHLRAEGLRYREIGEVLGMSLGAVAISLERSLAKLARADER